MQRTEKKDKEQLKLNMKYKNSGFLERLSISVSRFQKGLELHPFWKSGFSWLSLLSSIILSINSFLVIYFNFEYLPNRIAMMFAEPLEEDIVKDKYLLYFLPLLTIGISVFVTFKFEKLFNKYPKAIKFLCFSVFLLSLIQLIAVYKIINIYV